MRDTIVKTLRGNRVATAVMHRFGTEVVCQDVILAEADGLQHLSSESQVRLTLSDAPGCAEWVVRPSPLHCQKYGHEITVTHWTSATCIPEIAPSANRPMTRWRLSARSAWG